MRKQGQEEVEGTEAPENSAPSYILDMTAALKLLLVVAALMNFIAWEEGYFGSYWKRGEALNDRQLKEFTASTQMVTLGSLKATLLHSDTRWNEGEGKTAARL